MAQMGSTASSYTQAFKLVLLGESSGKTCLVQRFLTKQFVQHSTTLGLVSAERDVTIGEWTVKLDMWDIGGQERFGFMAPTYYRNADVVVVVYDITYEDSFKKAISLIDEVEHEAPHCIALVGNKSDLDDRRAVMMEKGSIYANQNGHIFMETSAKTGENVDVLFTALARKLIKFIPKLGRQGVDIVKASETVMLGQGSQASSGSSCRAS